MSTIPAQLMAAAMQRVRAGEAEEAARLYREVLRQEPRHPDASQNLGVLLVEAGQASAALEHFRVAVQERPADAVHWLAYCQCLLDTHRTAEALRAIDEAERSGHSGPRFAQMRETGLLGMKEAAAREAIRAAPESGAGWKQLGLVLQARQQYPEALLILQKAETLLPGDPGLSLAVGYACEATGQLQDASACFERAIALSPDSGLAHRGKAATLARLGRLEEAEQSYRRALELNPDDPNMLADYAKVLLALNRPAEAEARAAEAVRLHPEHHPALHALANALSRQRRFDEALQAGRRAVALKEDEAGYHHDLGGILFTAGYAEEGERHLRRAIELAPTLHTAWQNLGLLKQGADQFVEAIACFEKSIEIKPDFAAGHGGLGIALQFVGRLADSEAALQKAISLDAGNADHYNNLGTLYQKQGKLDEAARLYEKALNLRPDLYQAHCNLLFCHCHDERIGPEQLFREHVLFGERFEAPLKAQWTPHANDRNPERPLRVGFVSGDLREHAVAFLTEPIFEELAGSEGVRMYFYSNSGTEDAVTGRFRKRAAQWRNVTGDSDVRLCEKIRADEIDILVDMSGHTGRHRLTAFAHKPAPVQASWVGYPGTTGLTAVDYYLADRHYLPPGKLDDQFVEKIARLPAVVCFRPDKEAPNVSELPALANGYLTFASFNRPSKITASTVSCWSALLRAVPGSRMLLAGMEEGFKDPRLLLAGQGIDPTRLTIQRRTSILEYYRLHSQVDLCLDTVGYTGGTTTMYALWMGVPTLTTAGPTPAGRQGAAIMLHLGLSAYVAKDGEDFVKHGKRIARDLEGLARLRGELRQRMLASALGRPQKVAKGLEKAFRVMWRRWCAGLPPESFEAR